ncbi:Crp/Fnr family transcriptional regulator [Intestinimonas butyriciproducens]|uniref:CRP/FNR family transcriptional regulator n=2 Tax=Intestinimonas butyriciproducens TaxID=1297617 RepID=A0A2U1CE35_9FIRM|nr:Crp/Fnr family transcriptional regulator [Intestinimonas butyriciproducens]SCI67583.1 cAMP regulatory protein [uncultured Clostridium sp.]MBU5229106.1 Crp/Fnr family transcriptional regulator [Intestinimonas butyriciproducens]MCI6362068.1 Crp/Fnr family transcriptional regulator [Intestinimonas butyriciproducens]MCR1905339.1 Crp/Fnr family transcriptional regulator [Intestinimonas butyriciproducens]MDB7829623.1 Crp/Fnr family transcriptional regulator [Intestinimonas butyriciproducens]
MAYHWAPLAEGQTPRIYAPGQLIYLQGTEADVFYYLLSGKARSYISSASGGERVLATHRSGDLMGEASFFDACPRVSSAVAVTECRVVSVDRDRLDRIFRAHPSLALPMLQYLARTVRMLSSHVDNMSFLQADRRVARCLLTFQEETDGTLHCTHEELGAAVGVSRVTVSRVLSEFARRGFLETGYRSMRILDRGALIDFASQRED